MANLNLGASLARPERPAARRTVPSDRVRDHAVEVEGRKQDAERCQHALLLLEGARLGNRRALAISPRRFDVSDGATTALLRLRVANAFVLRVVTDGDETISQ